mmetsp:Transcript_13042/g.29632  ORF Transcript_13042/g.29632 Transcript_13042/m.29632 type:complete len:226 (+) Transcript_13042:169-846(+)
MVLQRTVQTFRRHQVVASPGMTGCDNSWSAHRPSGTSVLGTGMAPCSPKRTLAARRLCDISGPRDTSFGTQARYTVSRKVDSPHKGTPFQGTQSCTAVACNPSRNCWCLASTSPRKLVAYTVECKPRRTPAAHISRCTSVCKGSWLSAAPQVTAAVGRLDLANNEMDSCCVAVASISEDNPHSSSPRHLEAMPLAQHLVCWARPENKQRLRPPEAGPACFLMPSR